MFDDEGIDNNLAADGLTAFVAVEASVIDRNNPVSGNRKGKSDSAITFTKFSIEAGLETLLCQLCRAHIVWFSFKFS